MNRIWKIETTVDELNAKMSINMMKHLDIQFTEMGNDYLCAQMPVDHRTMQPYNLLHGGASVALAETLGSAAGAMCVDIKSKIVLGLEINANHIRSVKGGFVNGKAKPLHIGSKTHIWQIEITDENNNLVCVSRLTLAVLDK